MSRGHGKSAAAAGPSPACMQPARYQHHEQRDNKIKQELRKDHATGATKRPAAATSNRMGDAIAAGRWWSVLTFSWARSFLSLGSAVTLQEEHLEEIYESHERFAKFTRFLVCQDYMANFRRHREGRHSTKLPRRLWLCTR